MKAFVKENRILLLIFAIALIVAIVVIGGRIGVESKNKSYDIVLDYTELEEMAKQSDHDISWWLQQFKEMGITKVGLSEESLNTLTENGAVKVSADVMANIMKDADWEEAYPKELIQKMRDQDYDKYDVLVEADSPEDYQFVLNAVQTRFSPDKYFFEASEKGGYIVFDGQAEDTLFLEKYKFLTTRNKGFSERFDIGSSKLMYMSLGMLRSKVNILQKAGMEIVPRTSSYEGWNGTRYAKAVIKEYEDMNIEVPYMIVGGEAVAGKDKGIATVDQYINDNGISIGLIENTTQRQNILQYGVEDVVKKNDYQAVRVFSVWDYIQNRYQYYGYEGAQEIENTLFRAVVERNIRVIYFKPIKEYKDQWIYVTDVNDYKTMFANLQERLAKHHITYGQASVMENYQVPLIAKFLMGLGCVAGAVLVLRTIFRFGRKTKFALCALGFLGVAASCFVMPNHMELLVSFASAVILPCLAMAFIAERCKECANTLDQDTKLTKLIALGIATLIVGIILSLFGGIMTAAPISSVNYMLEIDIFRGVKAAQVLPILFFLVIYLAYFGYGRSKEKADRLEFTDIRSLLNTDLKVWMVLLGVVVLAVGFYYIERTGHESNVEVTGLEMIFRNALEDHLLARPRSKEFLFAFPCVMLFLYTTVRKLKLWPLIFGLGSVIGMTSVTNTFMHIRTPLYLGFVRTAYSTLFGIIVGIVVVIVFELLYRLYKKIERQIV